MKKINYKRVRRIKAVIYLLLLLLFLIPAILMIVVGVKILVRLDVTGNAAGLAVLNPPTVAGAAGPGSSSSPEKSLVFDATPLDSAVSQVSQLPVPGSSSRADEQPAESREADASGGDSAMASLTSDSNAPQSASSTPEVSSPEVQANVGQGGEAETSYAGVPHYGDTEIPNTGFPKPGEMA